MTSITTGNYTVNRLGTEQMERERVPTDSVLSPHMAWQLEYHETHLQM